MKNLGFVRVGSIVNKLVLADPINNANELVKMIKKAEREDVAIVSTPQLSLTGYTCGDLFFQEKLLTSAIEGLEIILGETKELDIISIIGMPLKIDNGIYNVAVVVNRGEILGIVPKINIPNYTEEARWFSDSSKLVCDEITLLGQEVLVNTNMIFRDINNKNISFAVEISEDLEDANAISVQHTANGANIILNLASSNEVVGRNKYRHELIKNHSKKNICAYVYASSGIGESTSDLVFSGASMIYEDGHKLAENNLYDFNSNLIFADVDVDKLVNLRCRNNNFNVNAGMDIYEVVEVLVKDSKKFNREYKEYPFVPKNDNERAERCEEIFKIQAAGLARRLVQLNYPKCVLGISGGLDSTLAFLVVAEAYKMLGLDNKDIIGVTMPGFGTTGRTYNNACDFVRAYGATLKEVSIKDAAILHMKDIGLDENDRSVAYENLQARERTQILMDIANMMNGFVIGTGDLSELALGWCTYNGDHMSMYSVNGAIPKTLVRYLVDYVADNSEDDKKKVLKDILDTPISPELLPPDKAGNILQQTESSIGPYVLHDFYLYHFLKYGASPKKIYFLAQETFKGKFDNDTLKKWLKVFVKRFFTQQFKRNCVPDGIKVGTIGLSPRGDLRMPSDSFYNIWLKEVEELD
ncbi:MAG: NAD(+) synthase [Bacilli bacterium]|nr:NAD(+) synthase [Bacilli bacterium]